MDKVDIETSIVSHASAWPSRDIETAARQQQARDWWTTELPKFVLVTSQLTLDEASQAVEAARWMVRRQEVTINRRLNRQLRSAACPQFN